MKNRRIQFLIPLPSFQVSGAALLPIQIINKLLNSKSLKKLQEILNLIKFLMKILDKQKYLKLLVNHL